MTASHPKAHEAMGAASPSAGRAVNGAGMDQLVPQRRGRRWARVLLATVLLAMAGAGAWYFVPSGLQVPAADLQVATATRGVFLDQVVVRSTAEPAVSVLLDAVESGRVEEVFVKDGAMVVKGQQLFRLSNPQRQLDLLARQSEVAQQLSNLINLRVSYASAQSEQQRRIKELRFELGQLEKSYARTDGLQRRGFVSQAAGQEERDKVERQRQLLHDEQVSGEIELAIKRTALEQMKHAIDNLNRGVALVETNIDALVVRAPLTGRLTNFSLQVGESVKQSGRVGRIDDPGKFKLVGNIDQFYLDRVAVGQRGQVRIDGQTYAVDVVSTNPQVSNGRFGAELQFSSDSPTMLRAGQAVDCQLALGAATPALVLPNGGYLNDSGGTWVFVLSADGRHAERRAIRIGRRSDAQVEVLSGLGPGERVIVSSYAKFDKSQQLELSK